MWLVRAREESTHTVILAQESREEKGSVVGEFKD